METATANKRKLIDIKTPVFDILSNEARRHDISLKRLIEKMLEDAASEITRQSAPIPVNSSIRRLIGSAKPKEISLADIKDDRIQYLLSR